MPWAAAGAIGGALIASDAASGAANKSADASKYAADIQAKQKQPWVDAGKKGLDLLTAGVAPGGQFNKPFTMADAQNSEAEKFAQQRANESVTNSAAARGGYLNSNALRTAQDTAGAIGSSYQNQAFNQNLAQNQMALGAVESLAQTGQTAATQVADAASNAALAGGAAQAGAQIAGGNAWANVLGSKGFGSMASDTFGSLKSIFSTPSSSPSPMGSYGGPVGDSGNPVA